MKMITKVFLVIAILLICLIAWALFLGDGGILQNAWNGIANRVNSVWQTVTGDTAVTNIIMPQWKKDTNDIASGQGGFDNASGNGAAGGN